MLARLRSCIECPTCHIRYIIGANPYRNGSYIFADSGEHDLRHLHCACNGGIGRHTFRVRDLKTYSISSWAHERGYGSPDEVVLAL